MVAKKRLPSLARRSSAPSHVLGNRRLPDIDAKLEQFAVDPGSAQSGLAMLMSRINCLTSTGTFGRPPRGRDFHRQYKRKPARCQRMTVSGLVIAKALSTSGAKPYSPTNTNRSMPPRIGRFGDLRRRILSWWRNARISISSEARDRNNPISPHQISLQSSIIEQKLHPIRGCSPVVLGLRQGQVPRFTVRAGCHVRQVRRTR
jgi:hypothetical protein